MHSRFNRVPLLLFPTPDPTCQLPIPLLIHAPHICEQHEHHDQLDTIAYQHGNIRTPVPGCFTRLERLGANDVSHAVAREQSRACELFLGVPGDIRAHNGETHAEAQTLEIAHPKRD